MFERKHPFITAYYRSGFHICILNCNCSGYVDWSSDCDHILSGKKNNRRAFIRLSPSAQFAVNFPVWLGFFYSRSGSADIVKSHDGVFRYLISKPQTNPQTHVISSSSLNCLCFLTPKNFLAAAATTSRYSEGVYTPILQLSRCA